MRMAELSKESGVAIATIKYYLREGLLPPGERTSPNQAYYSAEHVRRLKLIRALLDVGGLSINQVGAVLAAVDSPGTGLHEVLGVAQAMVTVVPEGAGAEATEWARAAVAALIAERGWDVPEDSTSARALVGVLATLRDIGETEVIEQLAERAEVMERIAELDVDRVAKRPGVDEMVQRVVVGSVLGDAVLSALRRMAQQNVSARRFREVALP